MHLTSLVLLAAVGASAHPSGHAQFHRALRQKRTTITATIDGKQVQWDDGSSPFVQAVHPAPAPSTPAPPPPPAPSAAALNAGPGLSSSNAVAGSAGQGVSSYTPFDTSCGTSSKRATEADIMYKGNTGCPSYGDNLKLVQSSAADGYDYNVKIISGPCETNCVVWNKFGADNKLDGFFQGHEALNFKMPPSSVQYIAIDANSQGGCSCFCGQVPTSNVGQWQGAWTEWDMGSSKNSQWSGADASVLVAGASGPAVSGLKVSLADGSQASSVDGRGGGTNAYLPGDEAKDGIGANIAPGKVRLVADYSYMS